MNAARPLFALIVLASACPSQAPPPAATLTGVEVDPAVLTLPVGEEATLRAFGIYDDGTRVERSEEAQWSSSSPQFASVDEGRPGRVLAVLPGTAAITASLVAFSEASVVEVTGAAVQGLVIAPLSASLALGQERLFTATGLLSDGSQADLSLSVGWTSSDPSIADFDPERPGWLTALASGETSILASSGGVEASAGVEVTERELLTVTIQDGPREAAQGVTVALSVEGAWSDSVSEDLTEQAGWSSSNGEVAAVTAGQVTALGPGTTLLRATLTGRWDEVLFTVGPPVDVSLELLPPTLALAAGDSASLEARVHLSDGGERDATGEVRWASSAPGVLRASNDAGLEGHVLGLAAGSAVVTAGLGDLEASAQATVSPAELRGIALDPPALVLVLGDPGIFNAIGTWSDGSEVPLSGASWSVDPLGVVALGASGAVAPLSPGLAIVTAAVGPLSGAASVSVEPAELRSIAVTPVGARIPVGGSERMVATGTWSDGTISDVSADAFWGSSAPGLASVTNLAGDEGRVVALAEGVATVLASLDSVSGGVSVEVVPAQPLGAIVQAPASLSVGQQGQASLFVTWTDGSEGPAPASWSSSDPSVLTTSNDVGQEGRLTAIAPGAVTVQGVFGALSADAVVEVQ